MAAHPPSQPLGNRSLILEGSLLKALFHLSLPNSWGLASVLVFNLIHISFIGQLGPEPLAAATFTFPIFMLMNQVFAGLGGSAASWVARSLGKGRLKQARWLTQEALIIGFLLTAVLSLIGYFGESSLFHLLGVEADAWPYLQAYMHWWWLGFSVLTLPNIVFSVLRAAGNTWVPSLLMVISAGLNLSLDPILIFGWGSIPAFGLEGAAFAELIARGAVLLLGLWILIQKEQLIRFTQLRLGLRRLLWRLLLSLGSAMTLNALTIPLGFIVITGIIGHYGTHATAAYGLASRIESLALIVPLALASGLAPIVGQNAGAKQWGRVCESLSWSFRLSLLLGLLLAISLQWVSTPILHWMTDQQDLIETARQYIGLVPWSYPLLGLALVTSTSFNVLGMPRFALLINGMRMGGLYIPLAFQMTQWSLGLTGVFFAAFLANSLTGILSWVLVEQRLRKNLALKTKC